MRLRFSRVAPTLLLVSTLALAGCESSQERAERFYQSGMKLLEAGDVDRALVEFRNVFQLNGTHKEARLAYARIQRERGAKGDAYGQYLRLVEQYPDTLEARIALAEMAIESSNWDEAERNGRAARDLAPQDIAVISVNALLDYRQAVLAKNSADADAAVAVAQKMLDSDQANLIARRIVVDRAITSGDKTRARDAVEAAIAAHPDLIDFYMMRLQIIGSTGDVAETTKALEEISERFPDNKQVRQMLIGYYMQNGNPAGAEALLRRLADAPGAEPGTRLAVVEFLRQTKGAKAAEAELDQLIAQDATNRTYQALRAAIIFEDGQSGEGIAQMEGLLKDATPSDENRNLKIALAQMLASSGNKVGARARVEEVLAEDPNHVEALKMQAAWLIDEDKPGDAILSLRAALAQAPRDVDVITLMGRAHERDGSRQLAGERYALAVEVSERAPKQSLFYANFLLADSNIGTAETVINDALTVAPKNVELLSAMAEIQMRKREWDSVTRIVWQLRAIGTPPAQAAANAIQTEFLMRQERVDETMTFLQELVDKGEAGTAAKASMVQIQVRAGRLGEAASFLDAELAKTPDEPTLRFLRAGLYVLENQPDQAETIYRALLKASRSDQALQALYTLLLSQKRDTDADALIDEVLAANPTAVVPRLIRAGALEKKQDFDGAIAIYDALYAEDSSNLVIANNLASLITTHRNDPAGLERAAGIARRLSGSSVPAFQDTYGWIEYLRGNYDEALRNLEPAAKGLPNDPFVQFHLGMTYAALNRKPEARDTLTLALKIAGDSPLPQFEEAKKTLAGLSGE